MLLLLSGVRSGGLGLRLRYAAEQFWRSLGDYVHATADLNPPTVLCLCRYREKIVQREWSTQEKDGAQQLSRETERRAIPIHSFIPYPTWMPRANHRATSQYIDPTVPPRSIESFTKLRAPLLIHCAVCESARAAALLVVPLSGPAAISLATACNAFGFRYSIRH
jgi:hypothetical protein